MYSECVREVVRLRITADLLPALPAILAAIHVGAVRRVNHAVRAALDSNQKSLSIRKKCSRKRCSAVLADEEPLAGREVNSLGIGWVDSDVVDQIGVEEVAADELPGRPAVGRSKDSRGRSHIDD